MKPPNQTCLVAGMASFSGDGLEPKGNPRGDTACRSPIAVNATQVPLKLEKKWTSNNVLVPIVILETFSSNGESDI